MHNSNAITKMVAPKSPEKANSSPQKHSMAPFYISSSLFNNRRLKQKRCKWATAAACDSAVATYRTKTESRKQNLSALKADITIDLLSDDDDGGGGGGGGGVGGIAYNGDSNVCFAASGAKTNNVGMHLVAPTQLQLQQHPLLNYHVYAGEVELSKVPSITLIPVQPMPSLQKRMQRKRKSRAPKRLAQPIIVNNESIVLTDDSESEAPPALAQAQAPLVSVPSPAGSAIAVEQERPKQPLPPAEPATPAQPVCSAQVDDEVTVSIVPRSSTAGSCAKPPLNNQLFPMLPDETTVHTVIANRIYELSLTKLREGLALDNGEQQKVTPTQRRKAKGNRAPTPPSMSPQQAPVSLKLSSDLSISLISDEEEEEEPQEAQLAAEKLLQQQPQLSVQHVQVPAMATDARQTPRRRKLG